MMFNQGKIPKDKYSMVEWQGNEKDELSIIGFMFIIINFSMYFRALKEISWISTKTNVFRK